MTQSWCFQIPINTQHAIAPFRQQDTDIGEDKTASYPALIRIECYDHTAAHFDLGLGMGNFFALGSFGGTDDAGHASLTVWHYIECLMANMA